MTTSAILKQAVTSKNIFRTLPNSYDECFFKNGKAANCFRQNIDHIWDKLFKNVPSKMYGIQPLKKLIDLSVF